jgi:hypothetical protein
MRRLSYLFAAIVWLPLIVSSVPAPQVAPSEPIVLDVPEFGTGLNFTNPQIIRDRAGVVWAATRADSSIGGLVWRVDGYVDVNHRGVPTQVNPTNPTQFFANGELVVMPDGYLWYVTVQIDNLRDRNPLAQTAWPVPGWTP